MSDAKKCPKCGAEYNPEASRLNDRRQYRCESYEVDEPPELSTSYCCLARQLAQAQAQERELALFKIAFDWKADAERLQAIVDRLPKTVDGSPIVPGMTVFVPHPHPSNLITEREVVAPYGTLACLTKEPAHSGCCESTAHRLARECYSTREAAEAASAERERA